jgi:class 3 adenylate cyclase
VSPVGVNEVGYARKGDRHVAFQVLGDGHLDLLVLGNGTMVSIDRDDEPHLLRFDRRLASFARLIRFDPGGFGLSDPLSDGSMVTIESWSDDAIAVLDAVGSERAALFATAQGGLPAMLLAATRPERVAALVLVHCWPRLLRDADYPWGVPQHVFDRFVTAVTDPDHHGDSIDDVELMAPTLSSDAEFRSWWKLAGQRNASPARARAMDILSASADLRPLLPAIQVPTLVMHRRDNALVPVGHARFLSEHIPDARMVELEGRDYLPFVGETEELLTEIEEFLTGMRGSPSSERVLATILFSDIVGSTARAAELGDRLWRELLEDHDHMVVRQVRRFAGRLVKGTGDGVLAVFDGPGRAIEAGLAMRDAARQLGLEVRVGIHAGELDRRGDDVSGIAVHIAARVQAAASPDEVCVSRTVADLVAGSGFVFRDNGRHELKGVPGIWHILAVDR